MHWFLRWFRRQRTAVELDPLQIALVQFVLRHGPAPDQKLFEDVALDVYAGQAEFVAAIASLVERGIFEPRLQPDDGTWFVLGPLGKRLRGKIPSVRSGVTVYV